MCVIGLYLYIVNRTNDFHRYFLRISTKSVVPKNNMSRVCHGRNMSHICYTLVEPSEKNLACFLYANPFNVKKYVKKLKNPKIKKKKIVSSLPITRS